jgi:S-adenosylmethionine decarboxylase
MSSHFGEHLTIDGYGGDKDTLNNEQVVKKLLTELPSRLDMHSLTDPAVVFAPGGDEKDPGGWSGFVIIAESHISVHTFPLRGFVSADIYTCKNGMDTEFVIKYFTELFKLQEIETNFIKRGVNYPSGNIYKA